MKVLLVSIAIGNGYLNMYNLLFRKSHENYAKKHKYDFHVITEFINNDNNNNINTNTNINNDANANANTFINHPDTISFQKILVCSRGKYLLEKQYDFIIFIDADILINSNSPALHSAADYGDKIGIIDEYSQPTPEMRISLQRKNGWEDNATKYYNLAGFDLETRIVLNSGVLVMQPKKHALLLERIYHKYVANSIGHPRHFHFEQSCIGYELQNNHLCCILPNKWNALWGLYKDTNYYKDLQTMVDNNYFTHFAGKVDLHLVKNIKY